MKKRIYLDHQATTPIDARVLEAMMPFLREEYGNPHSTHAFGWSASEAVANAKRDLASLIGAEPGEIVFTSGATEANNLALQGLARRLGSSGGHILTSTIEHKCVLNAASWLGSQGFDVEFLPVDHEARIDPASVRDALRGDTVLVSIMTANNEVGTIQPIAEIGKICAEHGAAFHTDAAQAVGKIPIDVVDMNVDLLSLSGHKFYGPKGIGALYISGACPYEIDPLFFGGAQQDGRRAGTLPTFLCVGIGAASEIAMREMSVNAQKAQTLEDAFVRGLIEKIPGVVLNSPKALKVPGHVNVRFPEVDVESLINILRGKLSFSTGSACNSGFIENSYVLAAMNIESDLISKSARFGLSHINTLDEVEKSIDLISDAVHLANDT